MALSVSLAVVSLLAERHLPVTLSALASFNSGFCQQWLPLIVASISSGFS